MSDGQHIGGRYGIWGINPYGPTIKQRALIPTIFNSGLKAAEGVQNLYKKRSENQTEAAKAKLAQETVDSEIGAANAKNQANEFYYPQQQAAKLQQEQATVKEIMARTGASYAQAQHMLASAGAENARGRLYGMEADPTMMFETLYSKLQSSPEGSPQRKYYSSLLTGMLNNTGGGMPMPGKGAKSSSSLFASKSGMAPGAGNMQINPLQQGSRGGYHQAATVDANGNPITVESPTMASGSRNQMRKEAEAESQYIVPTVLQGVNNYQGVSPTASALFDSYTARYGKPAEKEAARQRLYQLSLAKRFVPEVAAINARQATGQPPGIEVLREFQGSMFPNMPKNISNTFIPADIKKQAATAYPQLQQGLASKAIEQERNGYEQEGAPAWAATNNPYPNGYIDESGTFHPPEEIAPTPKQQQQPQSKIDAVQLNAWAEEAIAKGADPAAVRARIQQLQRGG